MYSSDLESVVFEVLVYKLTVENLILNKNQ